MDGYVDIYRHRNDGQWYKVVNGSTKKEVILSLIPDNSKVLDYGCGTGSLGFLGKGARGIEVTGFDIDKKNEMATCHSPDEVNEKFDVILLSEIIEHCNVGEIEAILKWCKPHGDSIILTTPHVFDTYTMMWFYLDITHVRPYDTPDLLSMVKAAGYQNVEAYLSDRVKNIKISLISRYIYKQDPYHSLIVYGRV